MWTTEEQADASALDQLVASSYVKKFKPTTHSRRSMSVLKRRGGNARPEKSLMRAIHKSGGRNSYGRITVRHRGGGEKRKYRVVDFKRDKDDSRATVLSIQYDPNRTSNIALVRYADGEKRYIIAPLGLKEGGTIESGHGADIKPGNSMEIKDIPVGTLIYNIELCPGRGGQLVRSAGAAAQLMAKEGAYAQVRLPSGEVRMIRVVCRATIGQVGNLEHENVKLGKAGRKRHKGVRPSVRGVVMNPNDHPHGGGEGKAPVGMPGPVSPWGQPALGYKTRNRRKKSNRFIVRRRNA